MRWGTAGCGLMHGLMKRSRHGDIARFDRWSGSYDRNPGQYFFAAIHRRVVEAICSGRVVPGRVLDIGCGTGRLLEALLHQLAEAELVGVDPAQGMITVASRRFAAEPRVRLEVATADHLPLDDASADVVTTTMSFHHWDHQDEALREVVRVLAPGGRLLLADVLGIGLFGRMMRSLERRHGSGYRDAAQMTQLLRDAGFSAWRRRSLFWPGVPIYLVEARRAAGP
jgi:ubiquinone/menaquinone biosynthesis C-methylase UbiE